MTRAGLHRVKGAHRLGDNAQAALPFFPLGLVVAHYPLLDCGQQAHDFFFSHFHWTPDRPVWTAIEESRLQQVFAAQNQAGGLRTAQAFTARIGDGIDPLFEVPIGCVGALGSRIDKGGHAVRVAASGHVFNRNRTAVGRISKNENHRRALAVGRLQLLHGFHFDKARSNGRYGAVVSDAVGLLHDDLVLHTLRIGQARHLAGIGARHAGGRHLAQRCGASGRHQGVFASHQFGNAPTDGVHQLGDLDVAGGRLAHGLANFGQRQRPAERRDRANAVDKGTNAEIGVGRYSVLCAHRSFSSGSVGRQAGPLQTKDRVQRSNICFRWGAV